MAKYLTASQMERVSELQRVIMVLAARDPGSSGAARAGAGSGAGNGAGGGKPAAGGSPIASKIETLQAELDEYVASECPFCGSIMINSIVEPFGLEEDCSYGDDWDLS